MRIELLYWDRCPSWHQALENLREALRAEGIPVDVSLVCITAFPRGRLPRFRGSPTILVSGQDLFPEQPGPNEGLSCRLYQTEEGPKGWPTVEMARCRLRALGHSRSGTRAGDAA